MGNLMAPVGRERLNRATVRNNNVAGAVLDPRTRIGPGTALAAQRPRLRNRHDPLDHVSSVRVVVRMRRREHQNHRALTQLTSSLVLPRMPRLPVLRLAH